MDLQTIEKQLKDLVKVSRRNKKRQAMFNSLVKRYSEFYERLDIRYFAKLFGVMSLSSARIGYYQKKIAWRLRQYLKNCPHVDLLWRTVVFKSSPMKNESNVKIAKSNGGEDSMFSRLIELRKLGHKATIEFEQYREGWGNEAKKDYRAWIKDYTPEPIPHGEPNGNGEPESLRAIFGDTIILRNGTKPSNRVKEPVGELDWRYVAKE